MHHGVGTNGRQMSMILGVSLFKAGFEVVAMDMPGYGCTKVNKTGGPYSYKDWVDIADDFINFELEADDRPIVLYGLSAGGMLTYHVAAQNKKVRGIIGMTFLDQRSTIVRDEASIFWLLSRIGMLLFQILDSIGLGFITQPMAQLSKMSALVNNPDALRVFLNDSSSAGSWVSVRFLNSYMNFKPALEPAEFDICPVLLTQPAEDHWTPLRLSQPFMSEIKKVPVKTVLLDNAGHYPLEDPGLQQMADAIIDFLRRLQS